jgi:hypothetical protein
MCDLGQQKRRTGLFKGRQGPSGTTYDLTKAIVALTEPEKDRKLPGHM